MGLCSNAATASNSTSGGSKVSVIGTRKSGNGRVPTASKRTASLSVVNTAAAPVSDTAAAMRATSRAEKS